MANVPTPSIEMLIKKSNVGKQNKKRNQEEADKDLPQLSEKLQKLWN